MSNEYMTSEELYTILLNAQKKIDESYNIINESIADASKKSEIVNAKLQYMHAVFGGNIEKLNEANKKIALSQFNNDKLTYDKYGCTVHAKFARTPINVFNFVYNSGQQKDYIFRNDVTAKINNTDLTESLKVKQDTKKIALYKHENEEFDLIINIGAKNILGGTNINVLEFDPMFPGAFDIQKITIKNINDQEEILIDENSAIKQAGPLRYIFDRKQNVQSVAIKFKVNSNLNFDFFGLNHIYFYDAVMATDSYIEFTVQKSAEILQVMNACTIGFVDGPASHYIDARRIELFVGNTNILPATAFSENVIMHTTKEIKIKMPILEKESIKYVELDVKTK